MGSVLTPGLLIILCVSCASANAARLHHSRSPTAQLRTSQEVIAPPSQGQSAPVGVAVPGWSEEATRHWLDAASANHGD
jgi:hypothetical protein